MSKTGLSIQETPTTCIPNKQIPWELNSRVNGKAVHSPPGHIDAVLQNHICLVLAISIAFLELQLLHLSSFVRRLRFLNLTVFDHLRALLRSNLIDIKTSLSVKLYYKRQLKQVFRWTLSIGRYHSRQEKVSSKMRTIA